jgi:hypothetical protein
VGEAPLTDVAEIKAKVLAELKQDPMGKLTPTNYRLVRDVEKVAGVLADEPPKTVEVNTVLIRQSIQQAFGWADESKAIDVDVER